MSKIQIDEDKLLQEFAADKELQKRFGGEFKVYLVWLKAQAQGPVTFPEQPAKQHTF